MNESDTAGRSRASAAGSCGRAASVRRPLRDVARRRSASCRWNSPVSSERATSRGRDVRAASGAVGPGHVLPARRAAGLQVLQLFQHLVQSQALDELHDVIRQAVLLADAEDRHDVGVVQLGRRLRLALEAPLVLGVEQHAFAAAP